MSQLMIEWENRVDSNVADIDFDTESSWATRTSHGKDHQIALDISNAANDVISRPISIFGHGDGNATPQPF